jgi:hypothetical protein
MARAAELYAAQFGKAATQEDQQTASVAQSTVRTDADAVARQENEGGPAVAQGTSGERLILRPSDPQAGQLPSRRRRVR